MFEIIDDFHPTVPNKMARWPIPMPLQDIGNSEADIRRGG
jgi:hypothetical protein